MEEYLTLTATEQHIPVEKYKFIQKVFSAERMDITSLRRMGRHGWKLYAIDKDSWKQRKGVEDDASSTTRLIYHFMRPENWESRTCRTGYMYEELVIWHHEYEEDARWYATQGWTKCVVLPFMLPKEVSIMRNGVKESMPVPCYIYVYAKAVSFAADTMDSSNSVEK